MYIPFQPSPLHHFALHCIALHHMMLQYVASTIRRYIHTDIALPYASALHTIPTCLPTYLARYLDTYLQTLHKYT